MGGSQMGANLLSRRVPDKAWGVAGLSSADQVVFVLQVVLALGPIAVYFLALGMVNSQARPCIVSARADFTFLSIAFVPVITWPVVTLAQHQHPWLAASVVVGVTGLFLAALPRRDAGWVIYNVSPLQCRRLLGQACRRLGWRAQENSGGPASESDEATDKQPVGRSSSKGAILILPVELVVVQDELPWLRNVTIRIQTVTSDNRPARERLIHSLSEEIQRESMLPSPAGASLVLVGAMLLGVPMWYLFHHMDLIVEAVKRILFA